MSVATSPALKHVRPSYMPKFVPDSSCVLWLPGQNDVPGTTIKDHSGNGKDGTLSGGVAWKRLSSGLWCLDFDGADGQVSLGDVLNLSTTDFTFAFWFRTTAKNRKVLSKFQQADDRWYIQVTNIDGFLHLYGKSGGVVTFNITGTSDTSDGAWHQGVFVGIRGVNLGQIYIDGVAEWIAGVCTVANADNTGTWYLARYDATYMDCDLALVRQFNATKTAEWAADTFRSERHLFGV